MTLPIAIMRLYRGGGSSSSDTQTVTAGISGSIPDRLRGYRSVPALGSITDGTSNLYAGATVLDLYHDEGGGAPGDSVIFSVNGVQSNSGWTTMSIVAGTPSSLNRASAIFSTSGGITTWIWTNPGGNPFGTSGTVRTVNFT